MKFMMFTLLILVSSCSFFERAKDTQLRLYVFDCGTINVSDVSVFSPGYDKGVKKTLRNTCYLIDHPNGKLIWDTGLPDALVASKDGFTNGVFHLTVQKTLESQIAELGINTSDIKYLALSHFHFDHSGNANLFKDSSLIIQREEFEAIYSKDPSHFHFDPNSYSMINKDKAIVISGDYDVFGDGTVKIIRTIGHTPGHQALKIKLKNEGEIVLSGDVFHFEKNRKFKRIPIFNFNSSDSESSMNKIEELVKKTDAVLWIQHDPEQFEKFKFSPKYYY